MLDARRHDDAAELVLSIVAACVMPAPASVRLRASTFLTPPGSQSTHPHALRRLDPSHPMSSSVVFHRAEAESKEEHAAVEAAEEEAVTTSCLRF